LRVSLFVYITTAYALRLTSSVTDRLSRNTQMPIAIGRALTVAPCSRRSWSH